MNAAPPTTTRSVPVKLGWLGLLVPGLAQWTHRRWLDGLLVASAAAFFWLTAATCLVVDNLRMAGPPMNLWQGLEALRWPALITPQTVYATCCALGVHGLMTWWAQRSATRPSGDGQDRDMTEEDP